jgi:hypothetical protein
MIHGKIVSEKSEDIRMQNSNHLTRWMKPAKHIKIRTQLSVNRKKNITTLSGAGKNLVSMKTGMMRKLQLRVFQNRSTKLLGSKQLAEKAFAEGPENYLEGSFKKTKDLNPEELKKIGKPIELSLAVDAACNGKGDMEYQGVWTFSNELLFKAGPYKKGSNNIGEFLALVHALAYLGKQRDEKMHNMIIYSDSKIAMSWIRQKKCFTKKRSLRQR